MSDLQDFFDERKQEVDTFIQFIGRVEEQSIYTEEIKILKSQAILMLYNLIEGTVNKGIETIFNKVSDKELSHHEASHQICIIWLRYFKLHLGDDGQHDNRLSSVNKFINESIDIDITTFREKNSSYFKGGSLDSGAIKEILKKFSIEFNHSEYKLKEIKKERNFLAHGEKSFTEIGQSKTVEEVKETMSKVIEFLSLYVAEIEKYLNEELYRSTIGR